MEKIIKKKEGLNYEKNYQKERRFKL